MSEWRTTTIGAIAQIFDGPHATPKRTETGPWFLNIGSLRGGRLDLSESAHISEEDFATWTRRVTPMPGDVLFSYETRLGEAAGIPTGLRACLGRRMGLLRPRPGQVNPRFLLYAYIGPAFQEVIRQRTVRGATVDRIPLVDMPNWPIALPPLAEQQAIAAALRALDDKISINSRIAEICQELAKLRYRDLTRTSLRVPLSSVADPILGGTPDRAVPAYWGRGNLWASAKDIVASQYGTLVTTEEEITDLAVAETKAKPVGKGSVILTARGTVGAVARVAQPTSLNQSCYAFTPDQIPPAVLYLMVWAAVRQMIGVAHGTVFSTVNMKTFEHIQVPSLTISEINVLENFATPLLDVVEQRVRENESLTELRDTLLPRLMSGELRVREAERIVEDAT